jgi:hypothetical protein
MFCDLKGATVIPRRTRQRQMAATVTLFPTWDADPITNNDISVWCTVHTQVIKIHAFQMIGDNNWPKMLSFLENTTDFLLGILPAMPSNK